MRKSQPSTSVITGWLAGRSSLQFSWLCSIPYVISPLFRAVQRCHEQLVNSNPVICIVISLGIVSIPLTCREVNRITRNFKQWRCKTLCRVEWELPSFWQMNFRCVHKVIRFLSWSISVKENSKSKSKLKIWYRHICLEFFYTYHVCLWRAPTAKWFGISKALQMF